MLTSARGLSVGLWVMIVLMGVSSVALFRAANDQSDSVVLWLFSPTHQRLYEPMLKRAGSDIQTPLDISLMSIPAIERKMMSGFFAGLPTADLIEVERVVVGRAFTGPPESIGFLDLTDRLEADGLLSQINPPSFGPWSSGGRIYGLPHDVHPVMLGYRADLVEQAGIDLSAVETWDDYFQAMAPLMADRDDDGQPDRWALAFWPTQLDNVELLMLQGDGRFFDDDGLPVLDSDRNAELLAEIVSWCVGPGRVAVDVEDFTANGHQQRMEGFAIGYLCPDWMCAIWKENLPPEAAGKFKLMPLPAFEPGGRRTSVRGGTMLGIPRDGERIDEAWAYAKLLYTSPQAARDLYTETDIITPVSALWDDPIFDEPDPFFAGQRKGRMFIDLAPDVPARTSSPYNKQAVLLVRDAAVSLRTHAIDNNLSDAESMRDEAKRLLGAAQAQIERVMARNAFTGVEQE